MDLELDYAVELELSDFLYEKYLYADLLIHVEVFDDPGNQRDDPGGSDYDPISIAILGGADGMSLHSHERAAVQLYVTKNRDEIFAAVRETAFERYWEERCDPR